MKIDPVKYIILMIVILFVLSYSKIIPKIIGLPITCVLGGITLLGITKKEETNDQT